MSSFLNPFLSLLALGVALAGAFLASDQIWLVCLGVIFVCLLYLVWQRVPPVAPVPAGSRSPDERDNARQAMLGRSVQMLAGFLLAGFLTLGVHLLRQQVVQADAVAGGRIVVRTYPVSGNTYIRETTLIRAKQEYTFTNTVERRNPPPEVNAQQNPRLLSRELRVQRGQVFDASGRVIAGREVYENTRYVRRTYPVDNMGYLLGYFNPTIYGLSGLEAIYDDYLSGETGYNPILEEENRILHRPTVGADLHLTLQPAVQDAATDALGERKGAVVVLDVQSGAILALASYPHFDPNGLVFDPGGDWNEETRGIVDYWAEVASTERRPDLPMLNRATQGLYPPGSTFKTVTLAAAIDGNKSRPDSVFTDTGRLQVEAGGYFHVDCKTCRPANHPSNLFTLMEAYQWSLNVVFAELAVGPIGKDPLVQYAQRFGFGQDFNKDNPALGVSAEVSRLGEIESPNDLAATSYGQGKVEATPLQMALVAAAIARGGEVPRPYMVGRVVGADGRVIEETRPATLGRAVSPGAAATLNEMMILSVERGWAKGASIPGFHVGGKTGTAETGRNTTHAWFIGVAGKDRAHPQYAVSVVLEEGGEGSSKAVPVARAALAAALGSK